MAIVNTVTGPIEADALGPCQPHEHLFVSDTPAARINPALRIDDEARSAAELEEYRSRGGASLIDCQPLGAGRDLFALRRLSTKSRVSIIAVTGYHMPMFYPRDHWIFSETTDALRERFLSELQEGVPDPSDGVRVHPGAVKAAIGKDGPADRFAVCLKAAAGAAARAGVPLIIHTERGSGAVEAIQLCEREGLAPAHIALCHADRQAADYAPHEAIARTGAYLEYDTIARYRYHDDASELDLIRHMLSLGYGHRLLISLDTTAARLRRYGGTPGLCYILREFIPMMAEAGISASEIHAMTHVNPCQLFSN